MALPIAADDQSDVFGRWQKFAVLRQCLHIQTLTLFMLSIPQGIRITDKPYFMHVATIASIEAGSYRLGEMPRVYNPIIIIVSIFFSSIPI